MSCLIYFNMLTEHMYTSTLRMKTLNSSYGTEETNKNTYLLFLPTAEKCYNFPQAFQMFYLIQCVDRFNNSYNLHHCFVLFHIKNNLLLHIYKYVMLNINWTYLWKYYKQKVLAWNNRTHMIFFSIKTKNRWRVLNPNV